MLQISEDTVQRYVKAKAAAVTQQVEVSQKPKKRLNVNMDELWSFVDDKGHEQWVWLAIDVEIRESVGVQVGDAVPNRLKLCGTQCRPCIDNVR